MVELILWGLFLIASIVICILMAFDIRTQYKTCVRLYAHYIDLEKCMTEEIIDKKNNY
jgi:hypothetical protein